MTLLLQAASRAKRKDSNEPSRSALLDFYMEIERIAQERRHADDQAAIGMRPDLKRGGLPKAQEREAQPQEVCHVVADPA